MISTIPPTGRFCTCPGEWTCVRSRDLLQGTYAHLAVSEYWRIRQQVSTGGQAQAASERFAFWHGHTRDAIEAIGNSGSLTPLGMRFVGEMRRSALREQAQDRPRPRSTDRSAAGE